MRHPLLDPRVWLPLAIAGGLLALREARTGPPLPEPVHADSIELPAPRLVVLPDRDQTYELDPARSSVRFHVRGLNCDLLVACPAISGRLELRAAAAESTLELRLDLASLTPVDEGESQLQEPDLRHLLGIHRGDEITYRATLQSTATSPLPGLVHRLWLGNLRFGTRTVRQPIGLWQTALPGQPLRLQGHGTVGADVYGLPRRRWFGLVEQHHVVTLGLDLAWKRIAAR